MSKKTKSNMDIFKMEMDKMSQWMKDLFSISSFRLTDEPDKKWKKAEIKDYMQKQGIRFNSGDTKTDLLQKIKWNS